MCRRGYARHHAAEPDAPTAAVCDVDGRRRVMREGARQCKLPWHLPEHRAHLRLVLCQLDLERSWWFLRVAIHAVWRRVAIGSSQLQHPLERSSMLRRRFLFAAGYAGRLAFANVVHFACQSHLALTKRHLMVTPMNRRGIWKGEGCAAR
eukprot:4349520-Prymnesium_polylepis.1